MKIRKDVITISAFVFIFVILSVVIFFFVKETSYEQVAKGNLKISEPATENYTQKKKESNKSLFADNNNTEPLLPAKKTETSETTGEPKLITVNMTEHPEAHSAKNNVAVSDGFSSITLNKGDTLWDVAGRTGSGNPWRWTDIMELNKDKIDYAYFNEDKNFWYVVVQKGVTVKVPNKDLKVRSKNQHRDKYALQLAAFSEKHKKTANDFVQTLLDDGYFAYTYKTDRKISPKDAPRQYYYRVRIGFFEDYGTATSVAELVQNQYKNLAYYDQDYFIVKPSPKEVNGDLFDYGIQMTKPYAVEFIQNEDRQTAVDMVRDVDMDKFYIYMVKQNIGDEKYAVRAGFFPTLDEAENYIKALNKKYNGRYSYARAIELENIHEALAGQNINFMYPN